MASVASSPSQAAFTASNIYSTVSSTARACSWNNSNGVTSCPSPPTSERASSTWTSEPLFQIATPTAMKARGNITIMLSTSPPDATNKTTAPKAAAGTLATQEAAIFPNTRKSTAFAPPARPTPTTAPTKVCVVETGTARKGIEKTRMVVAAPNSAAKPRVGVMSVIFFPMVSITRQPHVRTPTAIPAEPSSTNQSGISAFAAN